MDNKPGNYYSACYRLVSHFPLTYCHFLNKVNKKKLIMRKQKHWLDFIQGRVIFGSQIVKFPWPVIFYPSVRLNNTINNYIK